MTLQTRELSKTLTLTAVNTDRFKTGVLTFSLTLPLSPLAFAYNTLLTGLFRRGTEKYPSIALVNRRLDELYATGIEIRNSKNGKNLSLILTAEILDDIYVTDGTDLSSEVIEVAADILLHPLFKTDRFPDKDFESERKTALDGLRSEINSTRLYATKRCYEYMYRDDSSYPTTDKLIEILEKATLSDLRSHYEKLISSSSLDVFYIGTLDIDEIAQKLKKEFGGFNADSPFTPIMPAPRNPDGVFREDKQMPVSQGKLALGFGTGVCISNENDKYFSALVFNEVLGGSPLSKLFMNVREKLSLCYYCSSSYSIYTGDLLVTSGIEVKNRERAEGEILSQLDSIRRGEISEAELTAAKRSLENSYRQIYDNPLDLEAFYETRKTLGITATLEETIDGIMGVTAEEVVNIALGVKLDTVYFIEGTGAQDGGSEEDGDE